MSDKFWLQTTQRTPLFDIYIYIYMYVYTGCFFYILSHVSFYYSKTIDVTLTSFTNINLEIGGRLYSESQLTK